MDDTRDAMRMLAALPRSGRAALGTAIAVMAASAALAVARPTGPFASLRVLGSQVERRAPKTGSYHIGRSGQRLAVGDNLRTNSTGFGQVSYFEGSLTRLDRDTSFTVQRLARDASRPTRVRLEVGRTWNRVAKLAGSQGRFEVETPNAVAAVRGTAFVAGCEAAGACTFIVAEGKVRVTTKTGRTFDLTDNQALTVAADGTPVAPVPTPPPRRRGRPPPTPPPPPSPVRTLTPQEIAADPWIARNLELDRRQGPRARAAARTTPRPATPKTTPAPTTTPAAGPPTPARTSGTSPGPTAPPPTSLPFALEFVSANGQDRVSAADAGIRPDGRPDHVFRLGLDGEVESLVLDVCNPETDTHGSSHWDTIAGDTPIPPGFRYTRGAQTPVVGVVDGGGRLINRPDGSIPPLALATETAFTLHIQNDGSLRGGARVCFTVFTPGGQPEHSGWGTIE